MCVVSLKALGQAFCAPTQVPIVCQERSVMLLVYAVSTVQSYERERWGGGERERERGG